MAVRSLNIIVWTGLLLLLSGCSDDKVSTMSGAYEYEEPDITTFKELAEQFGDVPNSYRGAPLWVWNDQMTEENILASLKEMKEMGMGGVFIHPRPGLITEYLSEEYLDLVRYSIDRGKELGLLVWLYDENSYPSGFGGGHVTREMPGLEERALGLRMERYHTMSDQQIEEAYIILSEYQGDQSDVTKTILPDKEGSYYAFIKTYSPIMGWLGGSTYVDLLDPEVTEKFLEVTMTNGYEKVITDDEFGTVVPGIFSDEPEVPPPGVREIKYTPKMFDKFKERWGYDLVTSLPSLFEEVGAWRKVRHDYFKLQLEMFIDGWSKPYHNYTESKGLRWTGHYWEHNWPYVMGAPDNMAMYEWHQLPAIDMLFNDNERTDQFGNVFAVKELGSIANQLDKPRVLSETYGACGWEISFADMKRQGDWEYVLGVNFLNQHLSYMTIKGGRKRDHPVSFTHHSPWWKQYRTMNDYFGRLSLSLSSGEQMNQVLVIEPTTTVWMHFSPLKTEEHVYPYTNRGFVEEAGKSFREFVEELEKFQIEYDLGSEHVIERNASVNGDKFVVGSREYSTVVLPEYCENLEPATFTLLQEYLKNGGRVVSFADAPAYIDGEKTDQVVKLAATWSGQWIRADNLEDQLSLLAENSQFQVLEAGKPGDNLFHHRREFEDGQLVFWTNYNEENGVEVSFMARGTDVSLLNTVTGEIESYPFEEKDGWLTLSANLEVAGSCMFFIHKDKADVSRTSKQVAVHETEVTAEPSLITRPTPNVLTLDYCDLELEGNTYQSIYVLDAQDKIYEAFTKFQYGGLNHNPWTATIQYRTNVIDMGKDISEDASFKVTYPFTIGNGAGALSLQAVIEWAHLYDVTINGHKVDFETGQWWLDRSFNVVDLSQYVVEGRNELTIEPNPMTILSEVESVYLLGNFSLESSTDGWMINQDKPMVFGSWKAQGMPFYSDHVVYQKRFSADPYKSVYSAKLNSWEGTVAEVVVNGESAGIIAWKPYELDITSLVTGGENVVEVHLYGSTRNVLGPHHGDPNHESEWARNKLGYTSPMSFVGKPTQPAGNDYFLLDYGLYEDFSVVTNLADE
ncbi:MAG: glycosyl hydrolase [Bacteroidota bacterium]